MAVSHCDVPLYMWGNCSLHKHIVATLAFADFKAEKHVTYSALIGGSLRYYICLLGWPCCHTPSLALYSVSASMFSSSACIIKMPTWKIRFAKFPRMVHYWCTHSHRHSVFVTSCSSCALNRTIRSHLIHSGWRSSVFLWILCFMLYCSLCMQAHGWWGKADQHTVSLSLS